MGSPMGLVVIMKDSTPVSADDDDDGAWPVKSLVYHNQVLIPQ